MTIFVPKLHRSELYYLQGHPHIQLHRYIELALHIFVAIHAKEHAKTKKIVSNVLALNLVTQLYRMGAIEAARAPGAKKSADQVKL